MPEGDVTRLKTEREGSIIAVFIPYKPDFFPKQTSKTAYSLTAAPFPEATERRPTILMSHGTAVDLGRVLAFYRQAIAQMTVACWSSTCHKCIHQEPFCHRNLHHADE